MTLITRKEWGARAATGKGNDISPHPFGTAVHWEGVNVGSMPHTKCILTVLGIQKYHMDTKGWVDIAYSFLVCRHGKLFEGRGTRTGSAANGSIDTNRDWYAVAALIGPDDGQPSKEMLTAIGEGITRCRVAGAGLKVVGHRDLFNTACPGPDLYNLVKRGHWNGGTVPAKPQPTPVPPTAPKAGGLVVDGVFGLATKRRLQQWAGVPADGVLGPISWRAVQRKTGAIVDGREGPRTWAAIQRTVGATVDGLPGPKTYIKLQQFLNAR